MFNSNISSNKFFKLIFLIICTESFNSAHAPLNQALAELYSKYAQTEYFKDTKGLSAVINLDSMMKCGIIFSLLPIVLYSNGMKLDKFRSVYLNALNQANHGNSLAAISNQFFVAIMPETATYSPIEMDKIEVNEANELPCFSNEFGVDKAFVNEMCQRSFTQLNQTFDEVVRSKKLATLSSLLRMLQYILGKTIPKPMFLKAYNSLENELTQENERLKTMDSPYKVSKYSVNEERISRFNETRLRGIGLGELDLV